MITESRTPSLFSLNSEPCPTLFWKCQLDILLSFRNSRLSYNNILVIFQHLALIACHAAFYSPKLLIITYDSKQNLSVLTQSTHWCVFNSWWANNLLWQLFLKYWYLSLSTLLHIINTHSNFKKDLGLGVITNQKLKSFHICELRKH